MKTRLLTTFIATAMSAFTQADTIVVRDAANGKIIAEVDIDSKEPKLDHEGRTLTMERKGPVMELRARKCVLPKVEFRDATLDEVAIWLRQPTHPCEGPRGNGPIINFVAIDQAKRGPLLTINLEEVSLYDLLASLAKKYGLNIAYDDHAITVTDTKLPGSLFEGLTKPKVNDTPKIPKLVGANPKMTAKPNPYEKRQGALQ